MPLSYFPVFPCFWENGYSFGRNHHLLTGGSVRFRTGVGVGKILATPAPTPTPAKMTYSDQPSSELTRTYSTPTPQPWTKYFRSICGAEISNSKPLQTSVLSSYHQLFRKGCYCLFVPLESTRRKIRLGQSNTMQMWSPTHISKNQSLKKSSTGPNYGKACRPWPNSDFDSDPLHSVADCRFSANLILSPISKFALLITFPRQ